jgi:hypothetical protein
VNQIVPPGLLEQPSRATSITDRAAWDMGVPGDAQGRDITIRPCPSGRVLCRALARLLTNRVVASCCTRRRVRAATSLAQGVPPDPSRRSGRDDQSGGGKQEAIAGCDGSPHMIQINAAARPAANDGACGMTRDGLSASKWPGSRPLYSAWLHSHSCCSPSCERKRLNA